LAQQAPAVAVFIATHAARRGRGRAVSLLLATGGRENDGEWADNVAIGSGTIGSCGFDATKLYY